ncbi:serine hydrolase [Streptomyces polygonati]|uniref:Serine hydrolase n=1 Tax=Streptomyces polygonati TaxID=1617087 RepID=A0ABV8HWA8_9ACTN
MSQERSSDDGGGHKDGEDGIGASLDAPGSVDRWWTRQLVVSVAALAVMATLTLTAIVHPPSARAGSRAESPAASTGPSGPSGPLAVTTTTEASDLPASASPAPPASPPASPPPPPPSPSPSATVRATPAASTAPPPDPQQALARAIEDVPGSGDGKLSVGVADLDGPAKATYDSDSGDRAYDTASIVKVDILATLLLQHQHAGTNLSAGQRNLATSMIEVSDNDAAEALWEAIGGAPGLGSANATLGLRHTVGGDGDLWGLTQTTAADQLTLLRAVFGAGGSPLSAASRTYMKSLMTSISAGQRWGVSAADSDDAGYALKNGWLQRSATGLWDINSIGLVTYDGHRLLISVLSSGQGSEGKGIDLVEAAASAAAKSFTAALPH